MADDVEIGIDGSGAEAGVKRIINSIERIGRASGDVASKAGADFQKIYDKLTSLGSSSSISKYEKMTNAMERAASSAQKSYSAMSRGVSGDAARSAAAVDKMTSSLSRLENFRGPNKAAVRNVSELFNVLGTTKIPAGLSRLSALSDLSNYKGPSGASVENTRQLLTAFSATKLSSTLGRLTALDSIANFKGPSSRSVDSTERLLNVLSRTRISTGSLVEATGLLNAIGAAGGRLGGTATRANAASAALQGLNRSSRQGATGLAALAHQADKTNQALYHTERFFGTIANVAGLSFVANEIQKMDSSSAAIQTVTNNLAATTSEMGFLTRAAQENGTYLGSLTKGYSSFRTAASGAGLLLADTQSLFYGVTRASRVYNLSLDDQEGVYRALTQIMGKNSLQQEELRGQLGDRMPVAIQAMARALGVTIPVMNEMTKKGQVSGKVLTDAFSKLGPILQEMTQGGFTASMQTIGAKVSGLRTQALLLSVAMGDAGLKGAITNVLGGITSLIQEGGAVYGFLMNVGTAALFVSENMDALAIIGVLGLVGKLDIFGKVGTYVNGVMASMAVVTSANVPTTLALSGAHAKLANEITRATVTADGEVISQNTLAAAITRGTVAAEGSVAAHRLLAISMGQIAPAAAAATLGINATTISSAALMRVSSGTQLAVMSSGLGVLGKAAKGVGGIMSSLLAVIGLTNPWLIAAAAVVGLVVAFGHFNPAAERARKAQEMLDRANKLAANSAFSGANALDTYTASLNSMTEAARANTIATLNMNTARAQTAVLEGKTNLLAFTKTDAFNALDRTTQDAVRGAATSTSWSDTRAFLGNAQGGVEGLASRAPTMLGSLNPLGGTFGQGFYQQGQDAKAAVDTLTATMTASSAAVQGLALQMYNAGDSLEVIAQRTGIAKAELQSWGVGLSASSQEAASSIKETGGSASSARDRIRPLNMTLTEYVNNLESVVQASRTLAAISPMEDGVIMSLGNSEISQRLENLDLESQALKLGADAWSRYRESLTSAQKRSVESDLGDQLKIESVRGVVGSSAQEIQAAATNAVRTIWQAEADAARYGPLGAARISAIYEIQDAYGNLNGTMVDYRNQLALINEASLTSAQAEDARAQAVRNVLMQYSDALGIQGQLISAYDETINNLRSLDQLSNSFGIEVSSAKTESLREYAMALNEIADASPDGRIQARLRDNLTGIAESAAGAIDTLLNTTTNMRAFEEQVLRPQLQRQYGYRADGDTASNGRALTLADAEIDARRTEASMQRSAERFQGYLSAVGSSIDSLGDTLTDMITGAEFNFQELGLTITRELTKAFLIQPLMDQFKSGVGSLLSSSPVGSFLGLANTAAAGATDATIQAAALGTAATTAFAPSSLALNSSGLGLTAAATGLSGATVGLVGAATGLGGASIALTGAAAALGAAASATALAGVTGGAGDALGLIGKFGPMIGLPMFHSGGIVGKGGTMGQFSMSSLAGLERYHNGGIGGLKSREVGAVLKMGEEVLPENSPRHINNIGRFSSPSNYQPPQTFVGGDTYDISLVIQAPTPSGNPTADRQSQEETGRAAAEALDSVIKARTDKSGRRRSMKVQ